MPARDELIARLERAQAGSRELDCLIAREAGWHRVEPRFKAAGKHGGWIAPQDFMGTHSSGEPILDSLHGTTIHRDPPAFTTSIDAALSFLPAGTLWFLSAMDLPYAKVMLPQPDGTYVGARESDGHAYVAPIALIVAAMNAGAANGRGPRR